MTSTTFRTKAEPTKEDVNENIQAEETTQSFVEGELPYSEYQGKTGKPFLAIHYNLGDKWEVFNEELGTLDHYIKRKIETGEIANSTKAVKDVIKQMERIHKLKDEERTVIRLGTLASYIKFLNETEGIKFNWRKYGNT